MSQITHAEAQRLINFKVDRQLDAQTHRILDAHLHDCAECRNYARQLNEVENILQKIKGRWEQQPIPLFSIASLGQKNSFAVSRSPMTTRIVMTALTILLMAATATWRYSIPSKTWPTASQLAIPIPTPSAYLTSTKAMTLNCIYMSYQVQPTDTLSSLALQFSIPKETILRLNAMKEEKIEAGMQIKIPVCDHTPTIPSEAPNTIITIPPQFELITQTPA